MQDENNVPTEGNEEVLTPEEIERRKAAEGAAPEAGTNDTTDAEGTM